MAEWEEPRHLGPAVHGTVPHIPPLCNTFVSHRPTGVPLSCSFVVFCLQMRGGGRWDGGGAVVQDRVRTWVLQGVLQDGGAFVRVVG